ncbi:MAG: hypothetical protein ACO3GR_09380, partial [Candidatus Kapaibacteriota bacterium]
TGRYFAGAGITISNDTIINIGDRDSSNDVTIDRISANGEVLGTFDSLYIKDGAVRTAKLADTSVTGTKLNRMGATNGQILKWNGTTWGPSSDNGTNYIAGLGITISNDSIINTGDRDSTDDMPKSTLFWGDVVDASYSALPAPSVELQLNINSVTNDEIVDFTITEWDIGTLGATSSGQVLRWDGAKWGAADPGILYFESSRSSAVPNNAIPAHMLSPLGSEANIDFVINPKGNGALIASMSNNLSSGGEKRGIKSVDLQLSRLTSDQVARGPYSSLIAGEKNKISLTGEYSGIISGLQNIIDNGYSIILGGNNNKDSATYSLIGPAFQSTISSLGNYSSIVSGSRHYIHNEYSHIGGGLRDTILTYGATISGGTYNAIRSTGYGSTIGGGTFNKITDSISTISGGQDNGIHGDFSFIGGGDSNTILSSAKYATISGGIYNFANNWYSNVSGGAANSALGEGSSVLGGIEMVLESSARNSFGFNGNYLNTSTSRYEKRINITEPNTGVFNNVDLWITNNDNSTRTLRFYEAYNTVGSFPNGSNYIAFKAPNSMLTNVTYTLPSSAPANNGQVLTSTTSGTLSWSPGIVRASSINVNPGNLTAYGGSETIAVTVAGAEVGGTVQVSPRSELEAGIIIGYARVSAVNTVSIRFVNTTAGSINPAAVNVDISVIQP